MKVNRLLFSETRSFIIGYLFFWEPKIIRESIKVLIILGENLLILCYTNPFSCRVKFTPVGTHIKDTPNFSTGEKSPVVFPEVEVTSQKVFLPDPFSWQCLCTYLDTFRRLLNLFCQFHLRTNDLPVVIGIRTSWNNNSKIIPIITIINMCINTGYRWILEVISMVTSETL